MNSTYSQLRQNPPKLEVPKNTKEIIIYLVSCMCDNKHTMILKRDTNGEFKLNTMGFAYSNYQIPFEKVEIEWEADENKFKEVFNMINKGTSVIEKIRTR